MMTRHWIALASSLIVGAQFVSAASAQTRYDQAVMGGQATGLRPGWSRDGFDPATDRTRYVVSPAPTQLVSDSSSGEGRSYLPKWFSWQKDKPEAESEPQAPPKRPKTAQSRAPQSGVAKSTTGQRKPTNSSGVPARTAAPQESMPPDPAMVPDTSLPGLGGSPFPRTGGTGATAPVNHSPGIQSKTPTSIASNPGAAGLRTASRQPLAPPSDSTPSTSTPTPSTTRNSPGRRTAPHISADELRRELSGTFPAPGTTEAAPRAAQAKGAISSSKQEADAVVSDTPLNLSANSEANESAPQTTKSQHADQPLLTKPANTTRSRGAAEAFGAAKTSRSAYGASGSVHMPFAAGAPATPQTGRGKENFGDALQAASGGDPSVLSSSQTPVLSVDIRGPKQIQVGREAIYRVQLQNQSDIPADGVVATVRIPSGADVMNTTATQGTVQPSQDPQSSGQLQWHIARLDRRAGETLEVRLIPRESRPLELGVNWTVAPVASRAVVEVQEAKLQLEIAGPSEVLFNKPQVFKLTLTNPGTGPAENVKIELVPPGGGQEAVSSHPLGDLAPGATQTVEVELTAREAGKMFVKGTASAEGNLKCDASKEIFCRKPELEVDFRGPATKYAGTLATYFIRVRNPGTAPADDVTVQASLPDGAEFTSASEGQSFDPKSHEVVWHVGTLGPGDDNYMELKCVLKTPGSNRLKLAAATASGELTDSKTADTNVVAIADLKLDVTDPSGPVAVGTPAVYEIHIQNRGASAAKDVNVVALFSEGIEPEQADGAMYSVTDGRVAFRPIEELAAGRDIVLRIRAHATQPGTHVFRAEVLCRELDTKLAAEETTRFYADDARPDADQPPAKAASRSDAFESAVK